MENNLQDIVSLEFRLGVTNLNLKKARLEKGLLQKDVAKKLGISNCSYGQYENCRSMPNKERAKKIARILGKPVSYLFPEWFEIFTKKWKDTEKKKTVELNHESLDCKEVQMLETGEDLEREADRSIIKDVVKNCVKDLSPREQKILEMRFGLLDGVAQTLEEVGREFDVTRDRIRQIEAKALEKLQGHEDITKLKSYII